MKFGIPKLHLSDIIFDIAEHHNFSYVAETNPLITI